MDAKLVATDTRVACRQVLKGVAALGGLGLSGFGLSEFAAHAQSYRVRPIKLILPYTAGSPNDVIAA